MVKVREETLVRGWGRRKLVAPCDLHLDVDPFGTRPRTGQLATKAQVKLVRLECIRILCAEDDAMASKIREVAAAVGLEDAAA